MGSITRTAENLPSKMIEAHVGQDTSVTLHEVPIPKLTKPEHILVKVVVSGCNPKDWKMPAGILTSIANCPNSGDDVAGLVVAVGENVHDFRPGDRVAGLHQLGYEYGSFAEYALLWDHATFHIGPEISFEEAAVYPMALVMASMALFAMLRLTPQPWAPLPHSNPLVIYGASSSVGSMAVQLARLTGISPIICVAGGSAPLIEEFLDRSKGDTIVDYRKGNEAVIKGIQDALQGQKLYYAFDAISEKGSYINLGKVLDSKSGRLTMTLVPPDIEEIPAGIEKSVTMAGSMWEKLHFRDSVSVSEDQVGELGIPAGSHEFGLIFTRLAGKWLREGKLKARPYEVVPDGLIGVERALKSLRSGDPGKKYVVRIRETPGLQT